MWYPLCKGHDQWCLWKQPPKPLTSIFSWYSSNREVPRWVERRGNTREGESSQNSITCLLSLRADGIVIVPAMLLKSHSSQLLSYWMEVKGCGRGEAAQQSSNPIHLIYDINNQWQPAARYPFLSQLSKQLTRHGEWTTKSKPRRGEMVVWKSQLSSEAEAEVAATFTG